MYHHKDKTVKDNTDKNVSDIDKDNQSDSGVFSGNITDSIDNIESSNKNNLNNTTKENSTSIDKESSKINKNINIKKISENKIEDNMKVDSGFIENMEKLNINTDNLNQLDRIKKPSNEPILSNVKISNDNKQQSNGQWEYWFYQNEEGDTQLHIAIIQEWEIAASKLISLAPFPHLLDIQNYDGQTPLQLAVLTKQLKIVRQLIVAGADPEIRNIDGDTALHLAVRADNIDLANALTESIKNFERINYSNIKLSLPQNLEQRNYQGLNCLHIAAEKNSVKMVNLLLKLGADINSVEWLSGKSALHLAVEAGNKQVVTYLLDQCKLYIDASTYSGLTAYQLARIKNTDIAEQLLKHGAIEYDSDDDDDDDHNHDDDSDDSDMEQDTAFVNDLKESQQRLVYT